ncbi:MAG: zinc ABC transporter substrate-binding protein [Deltaproteobacteria bacterium]|nr:zinc ABC transporter substrate-binding protein [Deltaproteobacteria bacterium]
MLLFLGSGLVFAGFIGSADNKIIIAVSILPQAYFVENIGGDRVETMVMLPPGASPATYEPLPSQLRDLSKARVYIKVGAPGFPFEEAWFRKIRDANKDMEIVDSSKGISFIKNNPHIWLSPSCVKVQVENIYNGLAKIDPGTKGYYMRNKDNFLKRIDSLDKDIKNRFAGLENRRFMVFHPAWSYFARDYNLKQVPIQIEGKDPSPVAIKKIIEEAKKEKIKVIFVQPQFSTKSAGVIAKEIGGNVQPMDPLARDWVDNMDVVSKAIAGALKE